MHSAKWCGRITRGTLALIILHAAMAVPEAVGARVATADFPSKPIRWISPFAPGGASEMISRALGQKLTERWGQSVVVDFRPGAAGNIGTAIAAQTAPDGYTVVIVPSTFTTTPSLHAKPPFDPVRDFAPITLISSSALILVVNPSLPAKSVTELIAYARARPGQINFASSGIGASAHLAGELFKSTVNIDIVHVPYKGQAPALFDLIAGRVQIMFSNAPSVLPHVNSGKLRALAVTSLKPASFMPGLPTVAQSGLPGFEATQWSGLVAPAGTPGAIVTKYRNEIANILDQPEVHRRLMSQGFELIGSTPEEFSSYIRSEIRKWGAVIKQAGVRVN